MDIQDFTMTGRLTKDPEAQVSDSGLTQARFRIATHRWGRENGEMKEVTDFYDVAVWDRSERNRLGETCAKNLRKGREVCVVGRLQRSRWSGSDGVEHDDVKLIADKVKFLAEASSRPAEQSSPASPPAQVAAMAGAARPAEQAEIDPDDIPF